MLRIATWNVNSLKARLPRVEEWLATVQPDVICMQETKLADSAFPQIAFSAMGYEGVPYGEGRWNGVAILSKVGVDDVVTGFADGDDEDPEARLLWVTCGGVRMASVYVPNGRALDHEMYQYKLRWLARIRRRLADELDGDRPLVMCGDFNIAPEDRDVYDPEAFVGETHTSDPERAAALSEIEALGLEDVFRRHYDVGGLFSWWDYRAGNFHKGKGMRIDLVLASPSIAKSCTSILIDRNARKGKSPSDHAPVVADFDIEVP